MFDPSSADFANALKTISDSSKPLEANSFNFPVAIPVSSEIATNKPGTCSAIDLNSSPCNLPEPNACANCVNAALAC